MKKGVPSNGLILAALGLLLASCGGDQTSQSEQQTSVGNAATAVSQLVPAPQSGSGSSPTLAANALAGILESFKPGLTRIAGVPKCDVSVYTVQYATVDGSGAPTDATAAVMVPGGAACAGPHPVVLYGHGTTTERSFDMAQVRGNGEALLVAGTYAAQGFMVVAPNYAGYAGSRLSYHPYLNAEQEATDMVEAMRAARRAFAGAGARDSGRLFLAGYSQGGHAALATLRAMQQRYPAEFTVQATGGMSGPYAMGLLSDVSFGGQPALGGTVFLPMVVRSYQQSYGGIDPNGTEIFEPRYAAGLDAVLPGPFDTTGLFRQGKLPQAALFAPDSLPGPASPAFAAFFGDDHLVKTGYRNQYLGDMASHPCTEPVSCQASLPLRAAIWRNDLRDFVPASPTMLCGGGNDPTVFFASARATSQYFARNGMHAPLTLLDIDTPADAGDAFGVLKQGFAIAKADLRGRAISAGRNPDLEVASSYHGALVPAFCMAGTRALFQSVLSGS